MEENKNLVTEDVAENVEQTTEETPKTYTEAEFNERVNEKVKEVMGGKLARKEAKIRKEYDRKYGGLIDTLKAGTGKESVDELNDTFTKFYESKGITINKSNPQEYSTRDVETLARADAEEIINSGYDEVVEEVDRLLELGAENMTAREKAMLKTLAEYRHNADITKELSKIGVTEDIYNSKEFKDFQSKFNPNTPIADIYDIYSKTQPKKEFKTAGSMKGNNSSDSGVKDFYTPEEAKRFTRKELDDNPELYAALESSMKRWRKK